MSIIEMKGLTKYYGKSRGIIDVTLSVKEGEIFGFIGPNGAGKSTTIRTLLNFIFPTSGNAKIFGMDIIKNSKEIRKEVGYLPSEVNYYDDMKVKDLLLYSGKFYKKDLSKRIKELSNRLDLDLSRKIEDLSFGNKKKVSIVQALIHEPKLLILDEPTSGLDPLMQNTFFDILREERDKGVTIFFSSHILSEVQKICDRVGIIKEGKLIKVEKMEDITRSNFKNVHIIGNNKSLEIELEGIIKKQQVGKEIKLLYSGSTKKLIRYLNEIEFKDILIEEPTLEEIFMHYYEK